LFRKNELLNFHFSPYYVYLHTGDAFGFYTSINFRWILDSLRSALFATTKDDMLQQIKDQEVSNTIRTQISTHPWNIVKEIDLPEDQTALIDFGFRKCEVCRKMEMGFEETNHE